MTSEDQNNTLYLFFSVIYINIFTASYVAERHLRVYTIYTCYRGVHIHIYLPIRQDSLKIYLSEDEENLDILALPKVVLQNLPEPDAETRSVV